MPVDPGKRGQPMKVLVADPPANERPYDNTYPNVGILYVLGYLRDRLPGTEVRYLESHHNIASHVAFVAEADPDVYGISFTSKTYRLAADTLAALRARFPTLLLVCGGPHPSALPEDVLRQTAADVVVIGEGEDSFVDLVRHTMAGMPLTSCPGLAIRDGEDVIRTPPRPLIPDLDTLPFPAWDLIDHTRYPGTYLKKQQVESALVISRGCPFDCTFCSNPVWKQAKPWLRYRSHDNIISEIRYLRTRGVREVYFASDEMNFSLSWAKGLLRAIAAAGLDDMNFQCNLRVDKVDDELAALLYAAGFWLVHVGMESANDRVLRGLRKHITAAQIASSLATLSRAKVRVFGFMMLYNAWEEDGAFCHETTAEVDHSLRLCADLFRRKHIHYMSWQFCTPMPGSHLYDVARRHNLLKADAPDVWERFDEHHVAMRLPGVRESEMRGRIRRGILLKDWYMIRSGNISLRHLWRVRENLGALLRFR